MNLDPGDLIDELEKSLLDPNVFLKKNQIDLQN